jgi:hypothetical protein
MRAVIVTGFVSPVEVREISVAGPGPHRRPPEPTARPVTARTSRRPATRRRVDRSRPARTAVR